ncbi:hypothetical protein KRX52_11155 [Pseudomonas sp. MAP12]|uniref:Uncharacterized protein n=1 Tax=Geopseudomonas aromaticivorans TaxID=2849492 RepID=A0ABS6MX14_9GAMM|nr:hypothetical protein [Pseudomonas aromaticivorans]MBV2133351.1 hypothetical protein [Pseudomonas aromaticivorans]
MVVTRELSGLLDLARKIWDMYRLQHDPFRRQADRVLSAFKSHEIAPTQIGRLLPAPPLLSLCDLAYPDALKKHLTPELIYWVRETLQLEQEWLDGTSLRPHQRIDRYKRPEELHKWLSQRHDPDSHELRFTLHIFKLDDRPLGEDSQGPFVIVLEERFAELNDQSVSRYYYLTEGANFDHYPCLLHLLQILALAHCHGLIVRGWVMSRKCLHKLDEGEDLLPNLWRINIGQSWHPDDVLWPHMSGCDPRLEKMRKDLDESLVAAGMQLLVDELEADRQRWGAVALEQVGRP